MNTPLHLLVLSADPARPDLRLHADAGGRPLAHPATDPGTRHVLVVPATELSLHRLDLKAATPAQARAAAGHLLEGRLASALGGLERVVGPGDGARWVAVFAPEAREAWLARAAAQGFRPDWVVPDCLLLPDVAEGDAPVVAGDGALVRVRGHDLAFSAEPALAAHLLAAALPASADDEAALHRQFLAGARAAPALDLVPDAGNGSTSQPVPTRRLLALAAAAVLAPLLAFTAQGIRHELGAQRAHARADQALAAVAPDATGPGRPLARARAELARRQAPDRFGLLASALVEAQAEVPGTRLLSLSLDEDGVLAARLAFDQAGQVEQLGQALRARRIEPADQGAEPDGSGWTTTLLLSDAP